MALTIVVTGATINASDLNQTINVLQQPSGGQEKGKYFMAGPVYANGAVVAEYVGSLSRGATPLSVTIDEADQAHTGGLNATPTTAQLTASGFQVFSLSTTGPNVNARAGGGYTIQY